jgi:hypothetical protein
MRTAASATAAATMMMMMMSERGLSEGQLTANHNLADFRAQTKQQQQQRQQLQLLDLMVVAPDRFAMPYVLPRRKFVSI